MSEKLKYTIEASSKEKLRYLCLMLESALKNGQEMPMVLTEDSICKDCYELSGFN